MPNGLFSADTQFPQFTGNETEKQKLEKVQSYLYILLEQLRFTLANMDKNNFNETGFQEISEEITRPVVKRYESLDLTVQSDKDGTSASIQITGEGLKTEAKIIQFSGIVTFKALEEEGKKEENYTIINGAHIKTGTIDTMELKGNKIEGGEIDGANFYCTMDADNKTTGDVMLCYPTRNNVVGGLQINNSGSGTQTESSRRIFLYAQKGFVLKLESDSRISIEADDQVYIATKGGASISLKGNRVDINGDVYVNGAPIGG